MGTPSDGQISNPNLFSKTSNLWNSNPKSHDRNLNPNPKSEKRIPILELRIPIKSQSQISTVSTVSHSANIYSVLQLWLYKSTNTNKTIDTVLEETVTASMSRLLPSVVTAFQAAAAETPEVYLLATVWLTMYKIWLWPQIESQYLTIRIESQSFLSNHS